MWRAVAHTRLRRKSGTGSILTIEQIFNNTENVTKLTKVSLRNLESAAVMIRTITQKQHQTIPKPEQSKLTSKNPQ